MKASIVCLFSLVCAVSLATDGQLESKTGKFSLTAKDGTSINPIRIGGIGFIADINYGVSFHAGKNFEACTIPLDNKKLEDIDDPSIFEYTKSNGFGAGQKHFENNCVILGRIGRRYLAIKPIQITMRYDWDKVPNAKPGQTPFIASKTPTGQTQVRTALDACKYNSSKEATDDLPILNSSKENWLKANQLRAHMVFAKDKAYLVAPRGDTLTCEYRYWPDVPQSPVSYYRMRLYYTEILSVDLDKKFTLPGSEKVFYYWWEKTPDGVKFPCTLKRTYIFIQSDGTVKLDNKIQDMGSGAGVIGAKDRDGLWIDFVSLNGNTVSYQLRTPVINDEEKKLLLAKSREGPVKSEQKKEAGIKSSEILAGKKFYLCGVNFSWDVDGKDLFLEHEIVLPQIGKLEFTTTSRDLQNLNDPWSSYNLKSLGKGLVKVRLDETILIVADKGCIAIRATAIKDGDKVSGPTGEIITKMVAYDVLIIRRNTEIAQTE